MSVGCEIKKESAISAAFKRLSNNCHSIAVIPIDWMRAVSIGTEIEGEREKEKRSEREKEEMQLRVTHADTNYYHHHLIHRYIRFNLVCES